MRVPLGSCQRITVSTPTYNSYLARKISSKIQETFYISWYTSTNKSRPSVAIEKMSVYMAYSEKAELSLILYSQIKKYFSSYIFYIFSSRVSVVWPSDGRWKMSCYIQRKNGGNDDGPTWWIYLHYVQSAFSLYRTKPSAKPVGFDFLVFLVPILVQGRKKQNKRRTNNKKKRPFTDSDIFSFFSFLCVSLLVGLPKELWNDQHTQKFKR